MKIALISDIHYGARNQNSVLMDHLKIFWDEVFLPTLKDRKIDTVCILGDLLDNRKSVNINTAKRMRQEFLAPLKDKDVRILAGNHDTYNKNTNKTNSLIELLHGYENINIYTEPEVIRLGNLDVLMMPWICADNEVRCMEAVKKTKAKVCFAHLELKGIEMRKGSRSDIGMEPGLFCKFDLVATGHYHHASRNINIQYLGSPYQITWTDYGDKKGFFILDSETLELEFIENPRWMFNKIHYNDTEEFGKRKSGWYLADNVRNTYVKVVVEQREDDAMFDQLIRSLETLPVIDLQIVDSHLLNLDCKNDIVDQTESTLDILHKTINQMEIKEGDKKELNRLLTDLYNEAHVINA